VRLQLREFCAARSGDKGNISDVSVFECSDPFFDVLRAQVTIERVAGLLAPLGVGLVERYQLPALRALKLADNLGKTMGGTLLRLEVDVADALALTAPSPDLPIDCVAHEARSSWRTASDIVRVHGVEVTDAICQELSACPPIGSRLREDVELDVARRRRGVDDHAADRQSANGRTVRHNAALKRLAGDRGHRLTEAGGDADGGQRAGLRPRSPARRR
jgi:hypothetical protein